MVRSCLRRFLLSLLPVLLTAVSLQAANEGDDWPRVFVSEGAQISIHEPQIDSWDGFNLKAHAAVAVKQGKQDQVYGVVGFSALTLVDKSERMVKIEELRVEDANFPSLAEQPPRFMPIVTRAMEKRVSKIGLDRLEAVMVVTLSKTRFRRSFLQKSLLCSSILMVNLNMLRLRIRTASSCASLIHGFFCCAMQSGNIISISTMDSWSRRALTVHGQLL